MRETISVMNIKLGRKDCKIQFLDDKIGIPVSKVVEEMNRLDLNKSSSKNICDKIMHRLNKTPKNHKHTKN